MLRRLIHTLFLLATFCGVALALTPQQQAVLDRTPQNTIATNSTLCFIGNSYDANIGPRHLVDWARSFSGGRYYVPSAANLGLAGDRYEFASASTPGYFSRVGNCMAVFGPSSRGIVRIGNAVNNIANNQSQATINANFETIVSAIQVHANYPYVTKLYFTTTPRYWQMTLAQDTARLGHNNYLRAKVNANPLLYGLIDDARNSGMGFGDFGDQLHGNANGAFKLGQTEGLAFAQSIQSSNAYPAEGTSGSNNISAISLASTYVRITTTTAHGYVSGMPCRLGTMTSTFSPGLASTKWIVGAIISTTTFELYNNPSANYTGAYTSSGTIYCGNAQGAGSSNVFTATDPGTSGTTAFSTATYNGRTYATLAVTGTASAAADTGFNSATSSTRPAGTINDGWLRYRITNGAGTGPPIGLSAFRPTIGAGTFLGAADAWTLTITSAVNNDVLCVNVYNANTVAALNPPTPMQTDAPAYDATQYRISQVCITNPAAANTTTTVATAITAAINTDANCIAAGFVATSAANVITFFQPQLAGSDPRAGTIIFFTNTISTTFTLQPNDAPLHEFVDDGIMRVTAKLAGASTAPTTSFTLYAQSVIGANLDYKIWVSSPLYVEEEATAYAAPFNQMILNINTAPSTTLATSTATATRGQFSGGGLISAALQWYTSPAGVTATMTIASPAVVTLASHGFLSGQAISFTSSGTLPTGIPLLATPPAQTTIVYVCGTIATNTFNICSDAAATIQINTGTSQSGTHSLWAWTAVAGATANPCDLSAASACNAGGSLTGQSVINRQTVTNSFGSAVQWTTKSSGALPYLLKRDLDPAANDNTPAFINQAA